MNVAVFADVNNLFHYISKKYDKRRLDYRKYLTKALGDNILVRALAYGIETNDESKKFINCLRHIGFETKFKPKSDDGRRLDWDITIAMDVVRLIDRLDIVVIGSCDADLIPLVEWIQEHGVKVVIIASYISKRLKDIANQWIEIDDTLLEEIKDETTTTTE